MVSEILGRSARTKQTTMLTASVAAILVCEFELQFKLSALPVQIAKNKPIPEQTLFWVVFLFLVYAALTYFHQAKMDWAYKPRPSKEAINYNLFLQSRLNKVLHFAVRLESGSLNNDEILSIIDEIDVEDIPNSEISAILIETRDRISSKQEINSVEVASKIAMHTAEITRESMARNDNLLRTDSIYSRTARIFDFWIPGIIAVCASLLCLSRVTGYGPVFS